MGRDKLIIKNTCRRTHFSWGERLILQNYYNGANTYKKIKSPTLLGKLFGKNERTIRRELHRGKVEHLNTYLETIIEYNAEYAQAAAEDKHSAKGPELKIGMDWVLVNKISTMIKEYHYSPYAVVQHFNRTGWPSDTRICEKTIYNYIGLGLIWDVSEKDLLYGGKRRKPLSKPRKHSRAMNASRTIDKRPIEANKRAVVGHWEMDTVYSGKGASPECLLTLTERKLRVEIGKKDSEQNSSFSNS